VDPSLPPPSIDPKQRISELQAILELEEDKEQKINIEAVIAMYRNGVLPDPVKSFIEIQDGVIVDRPKAGKKSWAEGFLQQLAALPLQLPQILQPIQILPVQAPIQPLTTSVSYNQNHVLGGKEANT